MAVATHFRFRLAVPLLVATAIVASTRAQADGMHSGPRTCDIDQAKPRRASPLEPDALPAEPARPVVLDGVLYLEYAPRSAGTGGAGVHRAAEGPRCFAHPHTPEFGVIDRRIDSPRYY
jgi:hypothetical protein